MRHDCVSNQIYQSLELQLRSECSVRGEPARESSEMVLRTRMQPNMKSDPTNMASNPDQYGERHQTTKKSFTKALPE